MERERERGREREKEERTALSKSRQTTVYPLGQPEFPPPQSRRAIIPLDSNPVTSSRLTSLLI